MPGRGLSSQMDGATEQSYLPQEQWPVRGTRLAWNSDVDFSDRK